MFNNFLCIFEENSYNFVTILETPYFSVYNMGYRVTTLWSGGYPISHVKPPILVGFFLCDFHGDNGDIVVMTVISSGNGFIIDEIGKFLHRLVFPCGNGVFYPVIACI